LEKKLSELGLDYRDLAHVIGVSELGTYRRMRGDTDWKLPEVIKICEWLNYLNASQLFERLPHNKTNFQKNQ
jgi:predicted transcriptional regulator